MKEVKIEEEINYNVDTFSFIESNQLFLLLKKLDIDLKYVLIAFIIIISIISVFIFKSFQGKHKFNLASFTKYVSDCKNSIIYNRTKIYNKHPYITVCIPAYNMEKYIEKNLISIINQSFQDFEIIIVNDASEDKTENIIQRMQTIDDRIKLITHQKKLGVYRSRIETIYNSKSEYIMLMDSDDMYLNEDLFKELYKYNMNHNCDIIEFTVLQEIEGKDRIYNPIYQSRTHFHNFGKDIIYQPELSNLLHYGPGRNVTSKTICRNIWNKMIRKEIFINTHEYIGKEYYNDYIITADDMLMNIVSYQFAKNYSNIFLRGYLYVIRNISMSRGGGDELKEIRAKNYISYLKVFYRYIKDFNKNFDFLFQEMKDIFNSNKLFIIKENNMTELTSITLDFLSQISSHDNISDNFESFIRKLTIYFEN